MDIKESTYRSNSSPNIIIVEIVKFSEHRHRRHDQMSKKSKQNKFVLYPQAAKIKISTDRQTMPITNILFMKPI